MEQETKSRQKYITKNGITVMMNRHQWIQECINKIKEVSIRENGGTLRVTRESEAINRYIENLYQIRLHTQRKVTIYNDILRYVRRLKNISQPYFDEEDCIYFTIIEQYFIRHQIRIDNGNHETIERIEAEESD